MMITRLRGEVLFRFGDTIQVMTACGVGYSATIPASSWDAVPPVGQTVELHTHQVFREDSQTLYAFATSVECEVFRRLLGANGIGPKIAIGILSTLGGEGTVGVLMAGDISSLQRVPGIGKKTAERMVLEMRGKVDDLMALNPDLDVPGSAVSALVNLGVSFEKAYAAVRTAKRQLPDATEASLIRTALASMAG